MCCEACDSAGLLEISGAVVPWLLVIAGWFFVARDNNKRERRKELRAALSQLTEKIRRCEQDAHEYWMSSAGSERAIALGIGLKRLLQSIAAERSRLQQECKMGDSTDELIAYRRAVTGGDFEQQSRQPSSSASERLQEISESAVDLVEKLEAEFARFTKR